MIKKAQKRTGNDITTRAGKNSQIRYGIRNVVRPPAKRYVVRSEKVNLPTRIAENLPIQAFAGAL
jgi:hypothetical protein